MITPSILVFKTWVPEYLRMEEIHHCVSLFLCDRAVKKKQNKRQKLKNKIVHAEPEGS